MEMLNLLRAGKLVGTKRFSLSAGLTEFPSEIYDLADSLEVLDLSDNHLRTLPDDFGCLKNLKAVFFFNNDFEEIPVILAECPKLDVFGFKANQIKRLNAQALPDHLRWLILTDNQLTQLPARMGDLKKLQKLMLAGNQLQALPEAMEGCINLELIRLASNCLTQLPQWLLTLPRLAWLAYAGNPFCSEHASDTATSSLPEIDWADLTLAETLGQGASGVISKAVWAQPSQLPKNVAVKLFKGEMTSDGSPMDERQACMVAGQHPNLMPLLGNLVNHPEGKAGLVFALIPPTYQTMGGPPSLETCTRDTYTSETTFSGAAILNIAQGTASVAAHLHQCGILHGDLYPHNTLLNQQGESLLGDFGAASFYDVADAELSKAMERLEVRAFGCLLEDLLDRCDNSKSTVPAIVLDQLRQLQQNCLLPSPRMRPLFAEITHSLVDLKTDC